jgi:hypothetical protein
MLILRKIINPFNLSRLNLPQQTRHIAQVIIARKVTPVQMAVDDIPVIHPHDHGLCLKAERAELFEVRQDLACPFLDAAERMTTGNDPLDVRR